MGAVLSKLSKNIKTFMNTYYPNYFSTMRKKWLPIFLISSLIIFPSLYYRHIQSNYEKEAVENKLRLKSEQFIHPSFYSDGSAEYSLVANGSFPKEIYGNVDDEYSQTWVLRFDNAIECKSVTNSPKCENYTTKFILPRNMSLTPYSEIVTNDGINFFLYYPNLSLVLNENNDYPSIIKNNDILSVYLSSKNAPYKSPKGKYRKSYYTYSYLRMKEFNERCKLEYEFSKNLLKVRNLTESEQENQALGNTNKYTPKCIFGNDKSVVLKNSSGDVLARVGGGGTRVTDRYFYFDETKMPLSDGTCSLNGKTYICNFNFWLPQSRIARIQFHGKWLNDFDRFYKHIVKFFDTSTVVEKSINLAWPKS